MRLVWYYARVFGDEKGFLKYSKEKADYNPKRENTIAFFDHDLNELILHTELKNFEPVFAHELNHALLFKFCNGIPLWLNEGLSELSEDIVVEDNVFKVGTGFLDKVYWAKYYFAKGFTVKQVLKLTNKEFYDKNVPRNYSIAWATVAFLYMKNQPLLMDLIRIQCGNLDEIIEQHYPGGYPFLEADVRSFFYNAIPE